MAEKERLGLLSVALSFSLRIFFLFLKPSFPFEAAGCDASTVPKEVETAPDTGRGI